MNALVKYNINRKFEKYVIRNETGWNWLRDVCNVDTEYSCFVNIVSVMVIILIIIIIIIIIIITYVKPFRIFLLETNISGSQAIPPPPCA